MVSSIIRMPFHELIRAARKNKGQSQGDVARALGMTQATVSAWETGKQVPARENLPALALALALDVEELSAAVEAFARAPLPNRPGLSAVMGEEDYLAQVRAFVEASVDAASEPGEANDAADDSAGGTATPVAAMPPAAAAATASSGPAVWHICADLPAGLDAPAVRAAWERHIAAGVSFHVLWLLDLLEPARLYAIRELFRQMALNVLSAARERGGPPRGQIIHHVTSLFFDRLPGDEPVQRDEVARLFRQRYETYRAICQMPPLEINALRRFFFLPATVRRRLVKAVLHVPPLALFKTRVHPRASVCVRRSAAAGPPAGGAGLAGGAGSAGPQTFWEWLDPQPTLELCEIVDEVVMLGRSQ